jgi:hypothetical protein
MRRAFAFAVASAVLAACGGGGGGGGTTSPATQAPSGNRPIQSTSVQRAVASQALAVPSAVNLASTYGAVTGADVGRHVMSAARQAMAGWRVGASSQASPMGLRRLSSVVYSACSNGLESATIEISQTEVQLYAREFYDSACTKLYQDIFLDAVATSAYAATASGTDTYYSTSGQVYDYTTVRLSITSPTANSGTISALATDAPSATAAQSAAVGIACSFATTSLGCGFGDVVHEAAASQDLGSTLAFNATASGSATTETVSINGTGSAFSGSLNALTLSAGTFPAWVVGGGSTIDTVTFNGTETFTSSGDLTAIALTVSDAADDGTVTMSAGGTPVVISGTVKQTDTGQTLATFTVDASGNGTITYSNGTTAPISNWNVLG